MALLIPRTDAALTGGLELSGSASAGLPCSGENREGIECVVSAWSWFRSMELGRSLRSAGRSR